MPSPELFPATLDSCFKGDMGPGRKVNAFLSVRGSRRGRCGSCMHAPGIVFGTDLQEQIMTWLCRKCGDGKVL